MSYRNRISDCVKKNSGVVKSCSLIKLQETKVHKAYDKAINIKCRSNICPQQILHGKISPTSYKSDDLFKKPANGCDEMIGNWAEAIVDPKLASKTNQKMWNKFGYGMDWQKVHSLKSKHSESDEKSVSEIKTNFTKKELMRLSRNFAGEVKGLPVLSQRTLKGIQNPKLSLKGNLKSHFSSTFEEKDE